MLTHREFLMKRHLAPLYRTASGWPYRQERNGVLRGGTRRVCWQITGTQPAGCPVVAGGLLTSGAPSIQTGPDGCRRIVWMVSGMIKAHRRRIA